MVGNAKRKKPATETNGKAKKSKTGFSKESFLSEIAKLRLYVDGDRYYDTKVDNGRLELPWR